MSELLVAGVQVYSVPLQFEVKCKEPCGSSKCPVGKYDLHPEALLARYINGYNMGCKKALIYPSKLIKVYEFNGYISLEPVRSGDKIRFDERVFYDRNFRRFKLAQHIVPIVTPMNAHVVQAFDGLAGMLCKMRNPPYHQGLVYKVLYLGLGKNSVPSKSCSPVSLVGNTGSGKSLLLDRLLYLNYTDPVLGKINGGGQVSAAGVLGYNELGKFRAPSCINQNVVHVEEFGMLPKEIRQALMSVFYDEPVTYRKARGTSTFWSTYVVLSSNKLHPEPMISRRLYNIPLNGLCMSNGEVVYQTEGCLKKFRDKWTEMRKTPVTIPANIKKIVRVMASDYQDNSGLNDSKGGGDWDRIFTNTLRGMARAHIRKNVNLNDIATLKRLYL